MSHINVAFQHFVFATTTCNRYDKCWKMAAERYVQLPYIGFRNDENMTTLLVILILSVEPSLICSSAENNAFLFLPVQIKILLWFYSTFSDHFIDKWATFGMKKLLKKRCCSEVKLEAYLTTLQKTKILLVFIQDYERFEHFHSSAPLDNSTKSKFQSFANTMKQLQSNWKKYNTGKTFSSFTRVDSLYLVCFYRIIVLTVGIWLGRFNLLSSLCSKKSSVILKILTL